MHYMYIENYKVTKALSNKKIAIQSVVDANTIVVDPNIWFTNRGTVIRVSNFGANDGLYVISESTQQVPTEVKPKPKGRPPKNAPVQPEFTGVQLKFLGETSFDPSLKLEDYPDAQVYPIEELSISASERLNYSIPSETIHFLTPGTPLPETEGFSSIFQVGSIVKEFGPIKLNIGKAPARLKSTLELLKNDAVTFPFVISSNTGDKYYPVKVVEILENNGDLTCHLQLQAVSVTLLPLEEEELLAKI